MQNPSKDNEEGIKSVSEFLGKIQSKLSGDQYKRLVFRGQENYDWDIESSAARRLKYNSTSDQSDFIKYHKVILKSARDSDFKNIENLSTDIDKMNDMDLLANIQHFGGATCLTDFTTNSLIALWFATATSIKSETESEQEPDGAVFIINLKSPRNRNMFKDVDPYINNGQSYPIDKILTYKCEENVEFKQQHFWFWKPKHLNSRIYHQNSFFIFGLPPIKEENYYSIRINAQYKDKIRRELKEFFNINVDIVYPDLQGFSIYANNVNSKFNEFFCMDCIEIADSYLEENSYRDCNRYLDTLEKCIKKPEIKCNRNNHCCWENRKENVIANYYFFRASCSYKEYEAYRQKEHESRADEAPAAAAASGDADIALKAEKERMMAKLNGIIKYFKMSIEKKSDYLHESLRNMIYAMYSLGMYMFERSYEDGIYFFTQSVRDISSILESNEEFSHNIKDNYYAYFAILEMSIFSGSRDLPQQFERLGRIYEPNSSNGRLLLGFFDAILKEIYTEATGENFKSFARLLANEKSELEKKIKNNKIEDANMIFDYELYWDFKDVTYWADLNKFKAISSLAAAMDKFQKSCAEIYFDFSSSQITKMIS